MASNLLLIAVGLGVLWIAVTGRIKNLAAATNALTGAGQGNGSMPNTTAPYTGVGSLSYGQDTPYTGVGSLTYGQGFQYGGANPLLNVPATGNTPAAGPCTSPLANYLGQCK